mgnify:CR=1 FL=1
MARGVEEGERAGEIADRRGVGRQYTARPPVEQEAGRFHAEPARRVVAQIENDLVRGARAAHRHAPADGGDDGAVQVSTQDAQYLRMPREEFGERPPRPEPLADRPRPAKPVRRPALLELDAPAPQAESAPEDAAEGARKPKARWSTEKKQAHKTGKDKPDFAPAAKAGAKPAPRSAGYKSFGGPARGDGGGGRRPARRRAA